MSIQEFSGILIGCFILIPVSVVLSIKVFANDKRSLATRIMILWSVLPIYMLIEEYRLFDVEALVSYSRLFSLLMIGTVIMMAVRILNQKKEVKLLKKFIEIDGKDQQYQTYRDYISKEEAKKAMSDPNDRIINV